MGKDAIRMVQTVLTRVIRMNLSLERDATIYQQLQEWCQCNQQRVMMFSVPKIKQR
jgi:hypothetical protein